MVLLRWLRRSRVSLGPLWRHPVFQRFWTAQSISLFGSQVTALALPLCAIVLLSATPVQMGVLAAAQTVPYLLVGLPAGAWIDRRRRLPMMIACDVLRAVLLTAVPVAAVTGVLRIELLYLIAFAVGSLTTLFEIAHLAVLPELIAADDLVEGNAKLETTRSLALTAGPSIGGVLVQLLSAPVAILADVLSFVASALLIRSIRDDERRAPLRPRQHLLREIADGLSITMRAPELRTIAFTNTVFNFGASASYAVIVLFAARDLGLDAAAIGLTLSLGAPAVVLGAMLTPRLTARFGEGRTMIAAILVGAVGQFIVPFAAGPTLVAAGILALGRAVYSFCVPTYNVPGLSLIQAVTPPTIRGRVMATIRLFSRGAGPLGALVGGVVGEFFGLRAALALGGIFVGLAVVVLLTSPIRDARLAAQMQPVAAI
jgi:MFS family permease